MRTIAVISFCLLAVLSVAIGQLQVPVCIPAKEQSNTNEDEKSTGLNQGLPKKRIIMKEEKLLSGCPSMTFHLPRDNQVSDYIRYRNYVPRMPSATVCTWIETTDFDDDVNTIASYATSDRMNNAYLLGIVTHTTIRNHLMGPLYETAVPQLNVTDKFHICHWFSSANRTSGIYVNGKSITSFRYNGIVVAGGGDLILGQEQDAVNAGRLDAIQAFSGNITNFMIWPRVLTELEIYNIAKLCQCPIDHSIVFSLDKVELFGGAYYSIPETCPTL